jgi:hypothetical protein
MEQIKRKQGRPVKFTATQLEQLFESYKQKCKTSVHYKPTLIHATGEIVNVPFQQPLTVSGFCTHIQSDDTTFYDYCEGRSEEYNESLTLICIRIRNEINDYIDSGCLTGALNANYGARLRQLKENTETTVKSDGSPININVAGSEFNLST